MVRLDFETIQAVSGVADKQAESAAALGLTEESVAWNALSADFAEQHGILAHELAGGSSYSDGESYPAEGMAELYLCQEAA